MYTPIHEHFSSAFNAVSRQSVENASCGCETRRVSVSKAECTKGYMSILKRMLNAVSRRMRLFQSKKRQPDGLPFMYEDAKVGLLVPSSWFFRCPPSLRLASCFQTRICSCIGLPWHSAIDSFPSSSKRSFYSNGQFALTTFASGSAFCVHRPRTLIEPRCPV